MSGEPHVIKQDYHRNGVGGEGFGVSLVDWGDASIGRTKAERTFVAVSFFGCEGDALIKRRTFEARTAVVNLALLADGTIEMFPPTREDGTTPHGNAWRGADRVGPVVAEAYQTECRAQGWDPFDPDWEKPEEDKA